MTDMNEPPLFALGCKLESPHTRSLYDPAVHATHVGALFRSVSRTLSYGLTSLAPFQGKVFDQGQTNSCVGHRGSAAIQVSLGYMGANLPWAPSPRAGYTNARLFERTRDSRGNLPSLSDGGCQTSDYVKGLTQIGVEAMGPEVEGRHSDCSLANVNDEPTLTDLATEQETLLTGAYAIDTGDLFTFMSTIQSALAAGYAIGVDILADTLFQRWGSTYGVNSAPLNSVNLQDPTAGGHAILLTEMNVATDGSVVLAGPNSWGEGWGAPTLHDTDIKGGQWRATPDWLQKACFGATVFKVARQ